MQRNVVTVGYWIILILITCGGLLVVVAGSRGADGPVRADREGAASRRSSARRRTAGEPPIVDTHPVPIRLVLPASTSTDLDGQALPLISGAVWDIRRGVHDAPDGNVDAVVVLVHWADVLLAGEDLDHSLATMDGLLDMLSDAPALAVVGSIPDLGAGLAAATDAPDPAIIESTIGVWNRALADVAEDYDAEFVDLSRVPASICYGRHPRHRAVATAAFDLPALVRALEPTLHRAVRRVASSQGESG